MRIAALYDIHANLPALEAVLHDVERRAVDAILIGGDIAWGPFPRETVDLLQQLDNTFFVRGNADREVAQRAGPGDGLDQTTAEINAWASDLLTLDQLEWLLGIDTTVVAEVDVLGSVLFCHGSPRSDEESITPLTPEERLWEALAGVAHRTVVCGHTHMQFQRDLQEHVIVNPGSVGFPYQGEPGAFWALLGPEIELHRTSFDIQAAVDAMRNTRCPHVEEVFVETMLHPPTADEVSRHFEAIASRETY